ncbi:hypothetical protein P7K49_035240 [Saguinus oedipus]|uniref:Uncharacterized protein n=1 Tax=Saguinus oedipus TaxID=9490 RepID=A0ABQ9TMN8_SAGOE|nr:hypothetical protein P7K49_035240 [Saguinus oedipus]
MKAALEGTLAETSARFGTQLAQIQALVSGIEAQLGDVRADSERENQSTSVSWSSSRSRSRRSPPTAACSRARNITTTTFPPPRPSEATGSGVSALLQRASPG